MHDPGSSSEKSDKWLLSLILIFNQTDGDLYLCGGQKGTVKNENVEWRF